MRSKDILKAEEKKQIYLPQMASDHTSGESIYVDFLLCELM